MGRDENTYPSREEEYKLCTCEEDVAPGVIKTKLLIETEIFVHYSVNRSRFRVIGIMGVLHICGAAACLACRFISMQNALLYTCIYT